jgi:histidine triad (HIT) family protein
MEKDCIFCQIIQGEKPGDFVFQDDSVVAFKDQNPQAPVHILILPKKHIRSVNDFSEDDRTVISDMLLRAKEIAAEMSVSQSGYKLVFNVERGGGQYVFHLHLHLIGGWKR